MTDQRYNEGGYIALLSVLIVGAISISTTMTMLVSGVKMTQSALADQQSMQALGYADACAEEALQQIRESTSFNGSGSLSFPLGSCSYTVTRDGGQNRTIEAEGTVDAVIRRVLVEVNQINPTIEITQWREVANF